jgi:hypothetical protein
MKYVISIIGVGYAVAIISCFVGYFVFAFKMWQGRKPDVCLKDVLWNPFNVCFQPALLTEQGLSARKKWFLCLGAFAVLLIMPWVLFYLGKNL